MFIIVITGSRTFTDPAPIKQALQAYVDKYGAGNIILRHGNAKGADILAKRVAFNLGIKNIQDRPVEYYGYSWDDKNAGNLRNAAMLDEQPIPDVVLAFPDDTSRGTWNCVQYAKDRNIDVITYYDKLSHNNPHYPKTTLNEFIATLPEEEQKAIDSLSIDLAFGLNQEWQAAAFVVNDLYPGAQIHRLPEMSDLDFVITKNDEVKAFIEVKARRNSVNDYSTTIIAERKHICAREIYNTLRVQTIAIIQFTDALVSFHLENTPDDIQYIAREDRNNKGMNHCHYNHSRFTFHLEKKDKI